MSTEIPERVFTPGLNRYAVLARHLPQPKPGARWADLGGGAGEFSVIAAERGYEVTLVDGDRRNTDNAQKLGIRGLYADLNASLDFFQDNEFDGVSLIEVVEHIPMAERLVGEAFRIIRPGGILLLSTPNAVWWRERLRLLFGRQPLEEGYHFRFFNIAGAKAVCGAAGFQVDHMEYSTPAFGVNWVLRRILRRARRKHVGVPSQFARFFAQTIYLVGTKR